MYPPMYTPSIISVYTEYQIRKVIWKKVNSETFETPNLIVSSSYNKNDSVCIII